MSKDILKSLIDLIDDNDTEVLFRVLVRFIPDDEPLPDEIEAIKRANESIQKHGTVSLDAINWE